jgi:hypothetical protein
MITRSTVSSSNAGSIAITPNNHSLKSGFWRIASRPEGAGMASPASNAASIQAAAASSAPVMASSRLSPAEKQPGRSGTMTPKALVSVPGSMTIGLRTGVSLHARLFAYGRHETPSQVLFEVGHDDNTESRRMPENVVRAANPVEEPPRCCEFPGHGRTCHSARIHTTTPTSTTCTGLFGTHRGSVPVLRYDFICPSTPACASQHKLAHPQPDPRWYTG